MKEDIPPFLFAQGLKSRLVLLKKKLSEKTELLKTMPEGRIMVTHNHGTPQFYCISKAGGKRRRYLSKKQPELIRALAQKRLLENALPDLKAEITCTERLLQHYARYANWYYNNNNRFFITDLGEAFTAGNYSKYVGIRLVRSGN